MTESTEITSPKILVYAANAIMDSHLGLVQAFKEVVESRQKEQP